MPQSLPRYQGATQGNISYTKTVGKSKEMRLTSNIKLKYNFRAKPWQYSGNGGWHFISLPNKLSKEIRTSLKSEEEGWGRLKATAKIGNSEWETAIWFDTKLNTYLLPLKAEIRKKESLKIDKLVDVTIEI